MTFNLDLIHPYDREAIMLCCAGFLAQDNRMFGTLYEALTEGGQVEFEVPVGVPDDDLTQGVLFFSGILEEWEAQPEKAEQSATAIEFCRAMHNLLVEALALRRQRRGATFN